MSSSSSSSSSLSTISSSSSLGCCSVLFCDGSCDHFSNWNIFGINKFNSDNCTLYVLFDVVGATETYSQQVEIYSDSVHSNLVAIGQRRVRLDSGQIVLEERNDSGLYGSVLWTDGERVYFPTEAILACEEFSSSSSASMSSSLSTSSLDSSSSSSTFKKTSSSSTSGCCVNPICSGSACAHLTNWIINGGYSDNTDNCALWVVCDYASPLAQEVRLYKSSALDVSSLVALGQDVSGTIDIYPRNDSGISGSVDWDGVPIYYPSLSVLDCNYSTSSSSASLSSSSSSSSSSASSSSTSSSSQSISSHSSSSSSNSSSYSSSSKSSFSTSSSDSSSSSSGDSNSSSSESIGNFSSSSSSSLKVWNKLKPLILGSAVINSNGKKAAQSIYIIGDTYGIGKVFCYFYGPYGISTTFTIHLDIYEGDDLGQPLTLLASQTLAGSSIVGNGWYAFNINVEGITPSSHYLSFVIWQENGDEDNYTLWGYNFVDNLVNSKAFFSDDGIVWQYKSGIVRSLKIIGDFNAYDLDNYRVITPPAELRTITQNISADATFNHTKFVKGEGYNQDSVILSSPNLIASLVIDSSGSMGWNDRLSSRIDFIKDLIIKLKAKYSSNILFDMVRFGARVADTESIFSNLGTYSSIALDASTPNRTSYIFTISAGSTTQGAIYSHNENQYTVFSSVIVGVSLICVGEQDPLASGILTRVSGTGDDTITFSAFEKLTTSGQIIAFGFKNLKEDHTYNIGDITTDEITIEKIENTDNWQVYLPYGGNLPLSIGNNGPDNTPSLDLTSIDKTIIRKPIFSGNTSSVVTSKLISPVSVGDILVEINDVNKFAVGDKVDLVDGSVASVFHTVANVFTSISTIEITPAAIYDIKSWDENNGIVQASNFLSSKKINGLTVSLLVRDVLVNNDSVTFFLQDNRGLMIEWDFMPYQKWFINNLYWLDESALLPVKVFDSSGNPFPDGTKVVFYVGSIPKEATEGNEIVSQYLTKDAYIGDTKIYLASTSSYAREDTIDILDNLQNIQTIIVTEVGSDSSGPYLGFDTPLTYNFLISNYSKIIPSTSIEDASNLVSKTTVSSLLPAYLSLVDVTPIAVGRDLDTQYLYPYDPPQLPYNTPYSELSELGNEYIRFNVADIPTIDGEAAIRILPITEDNLKTVKERQDESDRLIRSNASLTYSSQLEQNYGDLQNAEVSLANVVATTTTTTLMQQDADYTIENPVYLQGGYAQSAMKSYSTKLTPTTFEGINIPGTISDSPSVELYATQYKVYPAIEINKSNGSVSAKQFLNPFQIYFANPINIYSEFHGEEIPYLVDQGMDAECNNWNGYAPTNFNGVYASGNAFSIAYTVTYHNALLKTGQLNVKIYSNTIADLEVVATALGNSASQTRSHLNVVPPKQVVTNADGSKSVTQPLSVIDAWRTEVINNPISQIAASASPTQPDETDYVSAQSNLASQYQQAIGLQNAKVAETTKGYTFMGSYHSPSEWTLASQYGLYSEITLNIINGKATLDIPSSDTSALIMVEASVTFGENLNYESIRSDLIFVDIPIGVSVISPSVIHAVGGSELYGIGTNVTWKGDPIADNVVVSFAPSTTRITPAVSKSDGGWAGGVMIGPKREVEMTCPEAGSCACYGIYEDIKVVVSYMGYRRTSTRKIEWIGKEPVKLDETSQFYFKINSSDSFLAYADGTSTISFSADLNSDPEDMAWIGEEGIKALQGQNQIDNLPCVINTIENSDLSVVANSRWDGGKYNAIVKGPNRNIGNYFSSETNKTIAPYQYQLTVNTSYKTENTQVPSRYGIGVTAQPAPVEGGGLEIPKPLITYRDPLQISIYAESYKGELIRDGHNSLTIVADITWKGSAIFSDFPDVTFESGVCARINASGEGENVKPIDARGKVTDCLIIEEDPSITLESYSATVSLSRTDIASISNVGTHTHKCTIDVNGYGQTTEPIILDGFIDDHIHLIKSYSVLASTIPPSTIPHNHVLRSVAVTKLNPTLYPTDISVNAYVVYDPTKCLPYRSSTPLPVLFPKGNRMMFTTLKFSNEVLPRQLIFDVQADVSRAYVSDDISNYEKAINIYASAKFSAYSYEDYPGHWIVVPEKKVNDGTRIVFEVTAYKDADPTTSNNIVIVSPTMVKKYMIVKVKGTIQSEGLIAISETAIEVCSNLQWVPTVEGILPELTTDTLYLEGALSQVKMLGSSQIHDAVKEAAQRLIQFQTDNSLLKDYQKVIFLLTDGDENTSTYSINQAINNVHFINGKCETPIIPLRLGYSYGSDKILMNKYANETCSKEYYLVNLDETSILDVIDSIILDGYMQINKGTYSYSLDLGAINMNSRLEFSNIYKPTGASSKYRYRFSKDGISWGVWSDWYDSSEAVDLPSNLDSAGRYFQYEVYLQGNSNFESPIVTAGITTNYYERQNFIIFFQPIGLDINSDEYLASIHITHNADIPSTSSVNYGYCQFNSTNVSDYFSVTRPMIMPNRHTIILDRYNEAFLTQNYQKYVAINGGWTSNAIIQVYRVNSGSSNAELIDSSVYAANYIEGSITFYNIRSKTDRFVLCVNFEPVFRVLCSVDNYGPKSVVIDDIEIMYNVTKRIRRDSSGNIIHI